MGQHQLGTPGSLTFTAPPAYLLELLGFWSDKSKFYHSASPAFSA